MQLMRLLVVGAGLSGLIAARKLGQADYQVVVVDKARAVGGRMASKRIGASRFDHGAQHFSVRSREFALAVAEWEAAGIAEKWFDGQSRTRPERGAEPRYRGVPHMRAICERIAHDIDVRLETHIDRIEVLDGQVRAVTEDGTTTYHDGVVITAPSPQALRLVRSAPIHPSVLDQLRAVRYEPCLAAMLTLDKPTGWNDGHLVPEGSIVAWMSDNQHKKVSDQPAVTVHASAEFSEKHLESPVEEWLPSLVAEASIHIPGQILDSTGHRWRYSQPRNPIDAGALVGNTRPPIIFAGEAMVGARVEGAFLSGLAAARAFRQMPARQPAF